MKQRALLINTLVIFSLVVGFIIFYKDQIRDKAKQQMVTTLLEEFSSETAQTRFLSYATTVAPLKRIELAKINQIEIFERSSQAKLFWDHFNLPEVVVRASIPVEYRYYVDLDNQWKFEIKDNVLNVLAPPLRAGTPSPDISNLKFEVRKGSLFRNEGKVAEALKQDLTELLQVRAQLSVGVARDTAREQLISLVRQWLTSESKGSADISIRFQDEPENQLPR